MLYQNFFKNGRRELRIYLVFLIGSVIALVVFLFTRAKPQNLTENQKTILETLTTAGISKRAATFWLAVSMFETGDFTSKLFKLANNAFGMKVATRRPTNRSGIYTTDAGTQFSSYASLRDSVLDLLLYQDEFNYPTDFASIEALVAFMQSKSYFGNESYAQYLAGVKSKLSKLL